MKIRQISFAPTMSLTALLAIRVIAATPDGVADCNQKKDLDRAIAGCSQAIQAGSKDAQVYVNRGFVYLLKDDSDPAFSDFETAIRLNPKEATAFQYRGRVFQIRGDFDRATADLNSALRLGSTDPSVLVDRGNVYASQGQTAKAIADYDAAIQHDPGNTFEGAQLAHLLRGIAYLYNGAPDKAQADFKWVTDINPREPFFAIWLHIAQSRNHAPSTLKSLASTLETTPRSLPFVRMFLGEVAPEELLAASRATAATQRHGMCDAEYYVAEFKSLQGQRDEAMGFYKAALQDCGRNFLEWIAANAALRSRDVRN